MCVSVCLCCWFVVAVIAPVAAVVFSTPRFRQPWVNVVTVVAAVVVNVVAAIVAVVVD